GGRSAQFLRLEPERGPNRTLIVPSHDNTTESPSRSNDWPRSFKKPVIDSATGPEGPTGVLLPLSPLPQALTVKQADRSKQSRSGTKDLDRVGTGKLGGWIMGAGASSSSDEAVPQKANRRLAKGWVGP